MPGRPKGTPKSGGRKKGSLSKVTVEVNAAIEQAFNELGGMPAFVKWAKENKGPYYEKLWGKLLPKDINVSGSLSWEEIVETSRK
jgi:hypothetical protein